MKGNFVYHNPTKLYFGPDSLNGLKEELKKYGPNIMLNYGGGSIKRNGIYDEVMVVLKEAGKTVVENPGVMSNPTLAKLREGVDIARKHQVDLILAVGGGSVCDYSKAVAACAHYEGDYWDAFYLKQQNPPQGQQILPVACVLTMAGTGSEMNAGTVITDADTKLKQMKAGIFDIMSHILEQYFSDDDDNTSDYLSEGLMHGLIVAARKAVKDPQDYEARSNIMWTATWALNGLINKGKKEDWEVHMIGHSVGAWTHAPHGYTLAAVSLAYYRKIMKFGLKKFVRFAENMWGVSPQGKTDEQIAYEGLDALKAWMQEIGLPLTLKEIGTTDDMLDGIARGTFLLDAGYHQLTHDELMEVLHESM